MNKLYEALEVCLNEMEQGGDMDTVLFRYPEMADELRPILEASIHAKEMTVPALSQEAVKRNRAKLLQYASDLRERGSVPNPGRLWSVPLRRALATLMILALLFVSGTRLVRAASATLPGDSLYPVKRTWEDVLVLLTFDSAKREALELEHENERLDELHELFAEGRSAEVDFAGYVTNQTGDEWRVSGITVFISSQTRLPDQPVGVGTAVRVRGQIVDGMNVMADRIEILPPDSRLPDMGEDELKIEGEEQEEEKPQIKEAPDSGPETEVPETETPETESSESGGIVTPTVEIELENKSIEGVVTSIKNNLIVVNGIVMDIQSAEIKGTPFVGAIAKVEGYYDANGVFVVTKIEFEPANPGGGSSSSNNNSNDDDDDHHDNSNDNGNTPDDDS